MAGRSQYNPKSMDLAGIQVSAFARINLREVLGHRLVALPFQLFCGAEAIVSLLVLQQAIGTGAINFHTV